MDKEKLNVVLVVALIFSTGCNVFAGFLANTYHSDALRLIEWNDDAWEVMNYSMGLMNSTRERLENQNQLIDELMMLNIAWSMYFATGNVSWLPQSPSEFENVTKEYGNDT